MDQHSFLSVQVLWIIWEIWWLQDRKVEAEETRAATGAEVHSGFTVWNIQVIQILVRGCSLGGCKPPKGQQSVTRMLSVSFCTLCTLSWVAAGEQNGNFCCLMRTLSDGDDPIWLAHQLWLPLVTDGFMLGSGAIGGTCLVLSWAVVQRGDEANCSVKVCPAWAVS